MDAKKSDVHDSKLVFFIVESHYGLVSNTL